MLFVFALKWLLPLVELNPPSRVVISKVHDFFYILKLFINKISGYEKTKTPNFRSSWT